jgi:hypothetical protein
VVKSGHIKVIEQLNFGIDVKVAFDETKRFGHKIDILNH